MVVASSLSLPRSSFAAKLLYFRFHGRILHTGSPWPGLMVYLH